MAPEPISRFEVFLVSLDPTVGGEIQKTRPCLVVSPDELNRRLATVIVAPMTSQGRPYPTRVPCLFQGRKGRIALDQLRTVDKARLVRRLGRLESVTELAVLESLDALFAE